MEHVYSVEQTIDENAGLHGPRPLAKRNIPRSTHEEVGGTPKRMLINGVNMNGTIPSTPGKLHRSHSVNLNKRAQASRANGHRINTVPLWQSSNTAFDTTTSSNVLPQDLKYQQGEAAVQQTQEAAMQMLQPPNVIPFTFNGNNMAYSPTPRYLMQQSSYTTPATSSAAPLQSCGNSWEASFFHDPQDPLLHSRTPSNTSTVVARTHPGGPLQRSPDYSHRNARANANVISSTHAYSTTSGKYQAGLGSSTNNVCTPAMQESEQLRVAQWRRDYGTGESYYWSPTEGAYVFENGRRVYMSDLPLAHVSQVPNVAHPPAFLAPTPPSSTHRMSPNSTSRYDHSNPSRSEDSFTSTTGVSRPRQPQLNRPDPAQYHVGALPFPTSTEIRTSAATVNYVLPSRLGVNPSQDAGIDTQPGLDIAYRKPAKASKFFKVGKVFKILWTEPAGEALSAISSTDLTRVKFGEFVYSKVRTFVIVREGRSYSTAVPILTYAGQGVAKIGAVKSEHAIVYTGKVPPHPCPAELPARGEISLLQPIRVDPDQRDERLDPMSRLDFGRVYTIQHNVKARSFGRVNHDFRILLMKQFIEVFSRSLKAMSRLSVDANGAGPSRDQWDVEAQVRHGRSSGVRTDTSSMANESSDEDSDSGADDQRDDETLGRDENFGDVTFG